MRSTEEQDASFQKRKLSPLIGASDSGLLQEFARKSYSEPVPSHLTKRSATVALGFDGSSGQPTTRVMRWFRRWETLTQTILKSTGYNSFIFLLLVYSLVIDDVRVICSSGSWMDFGIDVSLMVCMGIFAGEVVVRVVVKPTYLFSFWYFCDIVSTGLMSFELMLMTDSMGGRYLDISGGVSCLVDLCLVAVMVGRTGRVLRVVRLIRVSKSVRKAKRVVKQKQELRHKRKSMQKIQKSFINHPFQRTSTLSRRTQNTRILRSSLVMDGSGTIPLDQTEMMFLDDEEEDTFEVLNEDPRFSQMSKMLKSKSRLFTAPAEMQLELNDDSHVTRQLTEITITKVGIIVVLGAIMAPLLFAKLTLPDAGDLHANFLAQNFADSLTDPDFRVNYDRALADTLAALRGGDSSVLTSLGWLGWSGMSDGASLSLLNYSTYRLGDFYSLTPNELARVSSEWSIRECLEFSGWSLVAVSGPETCPLSFRRKMEIRFLIAASTFILISDSREWVWVGAIFSLSTTFFIFLVSWAASVAYAKDCSRLILLPVSRMTKTVRRIKNNPLIASTLFDLDNRRDLEFEIAKDRWAQEPWHKRLFLEKPRILVTDYYREFRDSETNRLEKTILKIGSLLVVGFGEAGTQIIGNNIQDSSSGGLTTLLPGRRVDAVFAFLSILDFAAITEVLEGKIVVLVNQVAEIVHGIVDEFNGFTCKNTGSGFFLVWKLPVVEKSLEPEAEKIEHERERLTELAITAFCEILCAINRSPVLAVYREHPHLKNKIPNFKVRVAIGLHLGWGIEGAAGSDFKLDASYLGLHASLAQRVASLATNVYRLPLLLTGPVAETAGALFSTNLCRRVDRVCFDASPSKLDLYTIDLDVNAVRVAQFAELTVEEYRRRRDLENRVEVSTGKRDSLELVREARKSELLRYIYKKNKRTRKRFKLDLQAYQPLEVFESDDLLEMRAKFTSNHGNLFKQLFDKGVVNYLVGEWEVATNALKQTLVFWKNHATREERERERDEGIVRSKIEYGTLVDAGDKFLHLIPRDDPGIDGPSLALLEFMDRQDVWKGYRSF